ncbi:MAG: tetratricopeptide repeat protein, partial [Bacteroidetes bacterium]|nr:tetratricopeptide repeat protein [Bacteroidota bacterium]
MKRYVHIASVILLIVFSVSISSCDYVTHRTVSQEYSGTDEPDPDYNISLDYNYQDFTNFIFLGNRSEAFGTYFNKYFSAVEDYEDALKEYRTSTISAYNRRLDSLNITPPVQQSTKDKFTKVIERCSKIIQYNKNTKYFDQAVLLVGLSYFYSAEYLQAERKFDEFLSRLYKSEYMPEALLYLGKTKFKLGKNAEAETILKNLLNNTDKNDIKSEIYQELAIYNLTRKNVQLAVDDFNSSIELTKDKEIKAERQFILAKIYSLYDIGKSADEYALAYKNTSNFDLEFYSRLNEAKVLAQQKKFNESMEILNKLNKKYIEYPEFKQLVELEIANRDYYTGEYKNARQDYFEIISKYPGGKAAAESYYKLGEYYENIKKDYLKALISYKKACETSSALDYFDLSKKKTDILDQYFTLRAVISDTTKIVIPAEEPDLDKYKKDYEDRHNRGLKHENEPNKGGLEQPKGGGMREVLRTVDSLGDGTSVNGIKTEGRDSIPVKKDSVTVKKDSIVVNIQNQDTSKTPPVNLDSIKSVKDNIKMNAYFQLAEIFYYDLKQADSSIFYLNTIINNYNNPAWLSKATFYLATIYKSLGDSVKAAGYFNKVVKDFPNSVYANESRINLGMPQVEQTFDAADSLISQASRMYESGRKDEMIPLLREAITRYPDSPLLPKALYSLGWA